MIVINYLDWWDKRNEKMETGQMNTIWEQHRRFFNKLREWSAVEEMRKGEDND